MHAFSNEEVAAARDAFLPRLLAAARAGDPARDLLCDAAGAVLDIASLRAFGWDFVREARGGTVSFWGRSHWLSRTFPDLGPSRRYVLSLSEFLLPGPDGSFLGASHARAVRSGMPLRAFFRSLGVWTFPAPGGDAPSDAPPPVPRFSPLPDAAAVPFLRGEIFEAVDTPPDDPLSAIRFLGEGESAERMPEMYDGGFSGALWRYAQAGWGAFRSGTPEGVARILATLARAVRAPGRFPAADAALRSVSHPEALSDLLLLALDGSDTLHFLPVFAYVLSQERFLAAPWATFPQFGMIADACMRFCSARRPGGPVAPAPSVADRALALHAALGYLERAVDAASDVREEAHATGLALRCVSAALALLADVPASAGGEDAARARVLAGALSRFFLAREDILGEAFADEEAAARALALHAAGSPGVAARRLEDDLATLRRHAESAADGTPPPHALLSRTAWQTRQALVPEESQAEERWRVAARAWPAPACDVFGGAWSPTSLSEAAGFAAPPPMHVGGGRDLRDRIAEGLVPGKSDKWWWRLVRRVFSAANCCAEGRTAPFEQSDILALQGVFIAERVEPAHRGPYVRLVLPMGVEPDGSPVPFAVLPLVEERGENGRLANAVGEIRSLSCNPLCMAGTARFRLSRGDNLHAFLPFFAADRDKFLKAARMAGYLWLVPPGRGCVRRLAVREARTAEKAFRPAADGAPRYAFRGKVLETGAADVQFAGTTVRRVLLDVGEDLPFAIPLYAASAVLDGARWIAPGSVLAGEAVLCADFHGFRDTAEAWKARLAREEPGRRVRARTPEEAEAAGAGTEQVAYEELVRRLGTANVAVAEPNPWRISFVTREDGARKEYALEQVDSPEERTEKAAPGAGMLAVCLDRSGPAPRYRFFGFPAPRAIPAW
ncbi:MAG: hypothetical protein IJS32_00060 [Kiritimatiellae bacterium]|nr:hypothetical protein [Kiritimatiellia bacterium]